MGGFGEVLAVGRVERSYLLAIGGNARDQFVDLLGVIFCFQSLLLY